MSGVTVKNNVNFPQFTFLDDLVYIAERIVIPSLQQNINDGLSIDGEPLPIVEPATAKRKEKLNQGSKTLIASRELINSFYSAPKGPTSVIISLAPDRKDIGGYLQITGIKTKKGPKFFNFFGINVDMENNALAYMKSRIQKAISDARKI